MYKIVDTEAKDGDIWFKKTTRAEIRTRGCMREQVRVRVSPIAFQTTTFLFQAVALEAATSVPVFE